LLAEINLLSFRVSRLFFRCLSEALRQRRHQIDDIAGRDDCLPSLNINAFAQGAH
jgi:hypothetical protein